MINKENHLGSVGIQTIETYVAAVYCRLSRDDNNYDLKSMSIQNQEKLLRDYVTEKGWVLYEVFIDDGYTGTNFDRPAFKRMIEAVKSGAVNCVITKDLSRLGRNYVETGYYTDTFFPEMDVRYIAVNDSMDTLADDNEMMAFHHVINEIYPRQISRKVRQVKLANAKEGKFNGGQPPYGYRQAPDNKHLLVVDNEAAEVVKNIFTWYAQGEGVTSIADKLNRTGILTPRQYYLKQKRGFIPPDVNNEWNTSALFKILKNEVYLGSMVHGRCKVVSFKSKKRKFMGHEHWIITENAHEPIVSASIWDTAQRQLERKRMPRTAPYGQAGLFSGILECADCGTRLSYMKRKRKGMDTIVYRCSRFCNAGKKACSPHQIREELLKEVVLDDIRLHARLAEEGVEKLTKRLIQAMLGNQEAVSDDPSIKIAQFQKRMERISGQIRNLYEDRANGSLPDDVFKKIMGDYSKEYGVLEAELAALQSDQGERNNVHLRVTNWANAVRECLDITELSRAVLFGLIDKIVVSERQGRDGQDEQRIRIVYRFAAERVK